LRGVGAQTEDLRRYDAGMSRIVLAALDGSNRESEVLRQAAKIAAADRATLHLCRAVTIPVGLPDAVWSVSMSQLDATLVADAEKALGRIAENHSGAVRHVRLGQPADVVCDLAGELGADLVVIGSHGYGTVERLLGTTASKIVHRAPCSVLVIRAKAGG
jgi:nucleotide-binding universal stress UspA family protein